MPLAAIACMFLFRHNPDTPLVDAHFIDSILMFLSKRRKGQKRRAREREKAKEWSGKGKTRKEEEGGEKSQLLLLTFSLSDITDT